MQISLNKEKSKTNAFTLIEMIGVLAVIGILAALLVPKIFDAINNARINSTAVSIATVKTAIADHYAKFGSLVSSNGTTITTFPTTNFDGILLTEGFLDKTLSTKLTDPTNTSVQLLAIPSTQTNGTTVAALDTTFDLADTNALNDVTGSDVVVVYLTNVLIADAQALNNIIDGPALGNTSTAAADWYGRVKYGPAGTLGSVAGSVTMEIYLTHR